MKQILINWRLYVFIGSLFLFVKVVNLTDLIVRSYLCTYDYCNEYDAEPTLNLRRFFDKE